VKTIGITEKQYKELKKEYEKAKERHYYMEDVMADADLEIELQRIRKKHWAIDWTKFQGELLRFSCENRIDEIETAFNAMAAKDLLNAKT